MLRHATLLLLLAVAGCWADFPDERFKPREFRVDQEVPDRQIGDLFKCTPSAAIGCTPDKKGIVRCTASGAGTVTVMCPPYTCLDSELRCDGCSPNDPSTCNASAMITCSPYGLPQTTVCSRGCMNGKCQ